MRDSDADIAIDVLNKLIDWNSRPRAPECVTGTESSRNARRHDTTPTPSPEMRSGRRSPMPWRSGMLGTRSSVSVMSWSRRICIRAICAAGGARVPCTACACATRTSPGWRPMCAPTACGGLDSGRSGRCRSRRIGGMSGGCRSIRREGGVDMATNVTQRNEVLRELLRWHLEKERLAANRLFDGVTPPRQADVVCGKLRAHTESSNHILSMLGYPDALPPAGRCPDDLSDR